MARTKVTEQKKKQSKPGRRQLDSSGDEDELQIDEAASTAKAVNSPQRRSSGEKNSPGKAVATPRTPLKMSQNNKTPKPAEVSINPYIADLLSPLNMDEIMDASLNDARKHNEPEFTKFMTDNYGEDKNHLQLQVLSSRRMKLENAVLQLFGCNGKTLGEHADKIIEIFKTAAAYGIKNWGKDPPATNNMPIDWNASPYQDLTTLLINDTHGVQWKDIKLCITELLNLQSEVSATRKDIKNSINNEFCQKMGMPLLDFAVKWKEMVQTISDLQEERNEPVSPAHSPKAPEAGEVKA